MSKLQVRIYDGTRQLFPSPADFLITITDGNRTQHFRDYFKDNVNEFDLPFFDNHGDYYTVVVWTKGYRQAGFVPVILSNRYVRTLDIMLVPEKPGFSFVESRWDAVKTRYPFLASGASDAEGATRFAEIEEEDGGKPLACLLNICEAMSQIFLTEQTPLEYIKELCWEDSYAPTQDRFFAWCDPRLIDQIKVAAKAKMFAAEQNPELFHPGATCSWKQIQFGEANVQLTFHEGKTRTIRGVDCIMVEPDIDDFMDVAAHAICEVISNALTHSLTDPVGVYVLRWIAGRTAGRPEFDPRYTITE